MLLFHLVMRLDEVQCREDQHLGWREAGGDRKAPAVGGRLLSSRAQTRSNALKRARGFKHANHAHDSIASYRPPPETSDSLVVVSTLDTHARALVQLRHDAAPRGGPHLEGCATGEARLPPWSSGRPRSSAERGGRLAAQADTPFAAAGGG